MSPDAPVPVLRAAGPLLCEPMPPAALEPLAAPLEPVAPLVLVPLGLLPKLLPELPMPIPDAPSGDAPLESDGLPVAPVEEAFISCVGEVPLPSAESAVLLGVELELEQASPRSAAALVY